VSEGVRTWNYFKGKSSKVLPSEFGHSTSKRIPVPLTAIQLPPDASTNMLLKTVKSGMFRLADVHFLSRFAIHRVDNVVRRKGADLRFHDAIFDVIRTSDPAQTTKCAEEVLLFREVSLIIPFSDSV
jgi:hypothetical protein